MNVATVDLVVVHVSARTNWAFVRVVATDGTAGWGEASLNGCEPVLEAALGLLRPALVNRSIVAAREAVRLYPSEPAGLAGHTVRSAVEQALVDVQAQAQGVAIHRFLADAAGLASAPRATIPGYANINRRTVDRSPAGCATSAREAIATGFDAVKIAPYDGVFPDELDRPETQARIAAGHARVAAIRDAIGPSRRILVDCHWRFDEAHAERMIDALAPLDPWWIECPVSEEPAFHDASVRLRVRCNRHGFRMAGAEKQSGVFGFRPIIERGLFDVVMPDIKHCGGYRELLAIARLAEAHGIAVSPHNPTGPVCHVASVHACAVAPAFLVLEHQWDESPLFASLVRGSDHAGAMQVLDGAFAVPQVPGLGLALLERVAAAHPFRPVPMGLDPRLG